MIKLVEGELEFEFDGALAGEQFDDQTQHGLSHCMKAVDFIVEFDDFYLFVEVKDPDNTKATAARRAEFSKKLKAGKLTPALVGKLRDSFLYRWAMESLDKPVWYVIMLQLAALQPPAFLSLTDELKRQLPLKGPANWNRPLVDKMLVLNITSWNSSNRFGSVRRI